MSNNTISDKDLRFAAKSRIARLFKTDPDTIDLNLVFGEDIKASFKSDWKVNEFDLIYDDVCDVADNITWKQLSSGKLAILTVGDYCEYMVRCYHTKPNEVIRLLFEQPVTRKSQ